MKLPLSRLPTGTILLATISDNDILTAIADYKSKSSLDFSTLT